MCLPRVSFGAFPPRSPISSFMNALNGFSSQTHTFLPMILGRHVGSTELTSSHSQWCQCSWRQTKATPFPSIGQMDVNSGFHRVDFSLATDKP